MSTQALAVVAGSPVRAGWIPLIIVLALGAVVAFLYFSMRKQLRRIDFDEGEGTGPDAGDGASSADGDSSQNGV